jgi:NAD-dependent dihydropyrimidine dehydrogenase PreA subunit
MPQETVHGVPRKQIPWHPTIDYEKCVTCGKCIEYCKLGVYELEEENGKKRTVVKNPDNCVVYCTGCDAICPAEAISHPSKTETAKIIHKLQKSAGKTKA